MFDVEKINNFSVDKSKWEKIKFGDLAFEPKESIKNLGSEGIKHVVGLEHIDSEDIHLRRSASSEESTTFTKKFCIGDVLFGRRRAYLKKAAQASFDGVCSGDITVLRAKNCLHPDLLPFIVNNEKFFDYAITHSAGGLSPRVKFKDLANYELLLPTISQQEEILELLESLDSSLEHEADLERAVAELKGACQRFYFECDESKKVELGSIAKVYSGGTPSRKTPDFWGGDIPWIKTAEVNYNVISEVEECISLAGLNKSAAKIMPVNTVLLAMYGQGVTRGRVALTGIEAACNQACAAIEVSDNYLADFLYFYLEYKYEELRGLAHGANQQNLNLGMVKSFKVPNLKNIDQKVIVSKFKKLSEVNELSKSKRSMSAVLIKKLVGKVF
jgi:type I restriction enzyme S subunit